jgi:hypothetical protein
MNALKMLLSLIPWVAFSLIVGRWGEGSAAAAALAAVALALFFLFRGRAGGVKVIDVAGVATFAVLAVAALVGPEPVPFLVAHYGRGLSALALALVMLGSVFFVPFTEQYARESVPRQYWESPVFRAVNRRISLAWGVVVLIMAGGHLLAGRSVAAAGRDALAVNLLLNWLAPIVLALAAVTYTRRAAAAGRARRPTS